MRLRGTVALALAVSVLGACSGGGGGSGGSAGPAPGSRTLSGTVAANVALAGYSILVAGPNVPGNPLVVFSGGVATTGPDGRYTVNVFNSPNFPPSNLIEAHRSSSSQEPGQQYMRLYSLPSRGNGSSNVTPLTSLLVARLANVKPGINGSDRQAVLALQNRSDTEVNAAQQQVADYLLTRPSKDDGSVTSPVDVSAVTDFVGMPLTATPGDPHFEALQRLHASLMESETIDGVEEHMLFHNDPPVVLGSLLELDFVANCTVREPADARMPRGTTHIVLDGNGVTFGTSFHFPIEPDDSMTVLSGQTVEHSWSLGSTARQQSVFFGIVDGTLDRVLLSLDPMQASAVCAPTSEVSLAGKHPSLMALIRRMAQSIGDPSFQCAGPLAPGFQSNNSLVIDNVTGALRINGAGGPTLHLPSLDITLFARFASTGSQLVPRISGLNAQRVVSGGLDIFTLSLGSTGQIGHFTLARNFPSSGFSQTCG